MTPPLARLARPPESVLLVEPFSAPSVAGPSSLARVPLDSVSDAVAYLRYWKADPGATAALRAALRRHCPRPVFRLSDDEVIRELARQLAGGALTLLRERRSATEPRAFEAAGGAAPAAAAGAAAGLPGALAPGKLATAPLLPLLEKVQIEGAEVLPEVLQTLERIDASMEGIDLASVSLEPAPSGVAPIEQAMREAGGSVTDALDDL